MNIKCIIIDDEPIARKGIEEYISRIDFVTLIGTFEDPMLAYDVLIEEPVDLILLDIEMPGLSGIEFIKSLKNVPYIIFTTAYSNYALEGYELDVVDYLVKPIAFPRFLKAVNKVKELLSTKQDQVAQIPPDSGSFFVKENGKFTKICYTEVMFVEAMQNYVAIHLPGKKVISYVTLSMLEKQLPDTMFMKVHKSYIVALDRIVSIEGNMLQIGTIQLPVSRNVKDQLMQKVVEHKLLKR
jgi:DNA-binding LytR/AlgR family response regulator